MQQEEKIRSKSASGRMLIVLKDSVMYGFFLGLSKMSIFFVLLLAANYYTNETYGILDTLSLMGITAIIFAMLGQDDAIGRHYYEQDDIGRRQVFSAAILSSGLAAITVATVGYLLSDKILLAIFHDTKRVYEFNIILLYIPIMVIINMMKSTARWVFNKRVFFILNVGPTVLFLIFSFFSIVIFKWGISGVLWSQTISAMLFLLVGVYLLRGMFTTVPSVKIMLSMLKYGVPLMLTYVMSSYLNISDKSAFIEFVGADTLGTYSYAARYAAFSSLPIFALGAAWMPVLLLIHSDENKDQTFKKTVDMASGIFAILMYVQLSVAEIFIGASAPAEYMQGIPYVTPLVLSAYIMSLTPIVCIGLTIAKKNVYLIATTAAGVVLFKLLTTYAGQFGGQGIAYSMLAAIIFIQLSSVWIARKIYPIKMNLITPYAVLAYSFICCIIFQNTSASLLIQIPLRLGLLLSLCVITWHLLIHNEDKEKLVDKIKQLLGRI